MGNLNGKVALITGGARGLGKATAEALAESGVNLALVDILDDLGRTVEELRGGGIEVIGLKADLSNSGEIKEAVSKTVGRYGKIDFLINNAGTDYTLPLADLTLEQWDRVISVNLRAPFVFVKEVLPLMQNQGGGHIVNITSTAAKRAWANASVYHASKWGLLGFTHALGVEGRPHRIKATAIITGGMKTPFLLDRFPDLDLSKLQDPANVAQTIVHVLSAPVETAINEVIVCPLNESSWP